MQLKPATLIRSVVGAWSALALCAACGGGAKPAEAPPPAASAEPSEPSAAPADSDSEKPASEGDSEANASPAASSDATSAPAAQAQPPSLVELCEEGCKKIKAKCAGAAYDNCHMNCTQYDHGPKGCEAEARVALECARDAEDVTCVNIAPEICAKKFQRVVACSNGKTLETKEVEAPKVPSGWERYSAKAAGFSALMPKGVSETSEGGEPHFVSKEGDAVYTVRVTAAPKEKPTQKNMVKVAMNVLGKCNRNMKLYSMVERPEKTFLRFDSKCPDGVEWSGAFVIIGSKMYMPFVTYPKGGGAKRKSELEAFVFNFEVAK